MTKDFIYPSAGNCKRLEHMGLVSMEQQPEKAVMKNIRAPQKGRNSCLWLQSRSVLSSFGVVLMSCRVNFHVVRSALQYSACRILYVYFSFLLIRSL